MTSPSGATESTVIDGFTIRNGKASSGGGIYCSGSPTISNNTITGNSASSDGGGIHLVDYSSSAISNNTITGNSADSNGGGIYCDYYSSPTMSNNIVAFNSSGIYKTGSGAPVLQYNDVYGNTSYNYSGISPGTGDISLDPLLVEKDNGDYHLQTGSPCIDTGTNTGAPSTDKDGCIRPQDGDGNGTAVCDIGAYEYPLNLAHAKRTYANGTAIAFGGVPITASFPGSVYVERTDRSQGIRVDTSKTFAEGDVVNVSGAIQTDPATDERYVQAAGSSPELMGMSLLLKPLAMPNRSLVEELPGFRTASLEAPT